jgi:HemK family putative methylases
LSISLAIEFPNSKVQSFDISEKAINIAKINSEKLHANNISFQKLDFLKSGMKTFHNFDLLISNPPYIPKKDMESLMPEVRNFEPYNALTDNNDGLEFYRKFSSDLPYILNSNGIGIFEVGLSPHPKDAKKIFNKIGRSIKLLKDYNGDDRLLIVKL